MNDLFVIALGAGLQDGLNPCIFMTCAVFIAHGQWLKNRSCPTGWLRSIFVVVYLLGTLLFNFGPGQILILQKNFMFTAKVLYFIFGLWAFVSGVLFLKEWLLLHRGMVLEDKADQKIKFLSVGSVGMWLTTVVFAVVLSALATLWPANQYIVILGNAAMLKGQWQIIMLLLVSYAVASMWVLWLVWAFLSVKSLRLSLLKIFYASIFFTASSCMIFMFR